MTAQLQALIVHPGHRSHPGSGVRTITGDLPTLQGLVGGHIEAVYGYRTPAGADTDRPRIMFVLNKAANRKRRFLNRVTARNVATLPENGLATALWWHYNRDAIGAAVLVGPVVIVGGPDNNGDNTALPADVVGVYTDLRRRQLLHRIGLLAADSPGSGHRSATAERPDPGVCSAGHARPGDITTMSVALRPARPPPRRRRPSRFAPHPVMPPRARAGPAHRARLGAPRAGRRHARRAPSSPCCRAAIR
ncbi:DUF3846 domain-containing protein [Mycobacterium kyorinense]|uniref:DUF3846 domain-containing protein n=1 Tax=Mycobacterium kyorinense TaxID=487514 RepID=A0A1X1YHK8_9MYCO|nr:hypothetical protein AWC14_20100 [Mycobacterium kyorinense]